MHGPPSGLLQRHVHEFRLRCIQLRELRAQVRDPQFLCVRVLYGKGCNRCDAGKNSSYVRCRKSDLPDSDKPRYLITPFFPVLPRTRTELTKVPLSVCSPVILADTHFRAPSRVGTGWWNTGISQVCPLPVHPGDRGWSFSTPCPCMDTGMGSQEKREMTEKYFTRYTLPASPVPRVPSSRRTFVRSRHGNRYVFSTQGRG